MEDKEKETAADEAGQSSEKETLAAEKAEEKIPEGEKESEKEPKESAVKTEEAEEADKAGEPDKAKEPDDVSGDGDKEQEDSEEESADSGKESKASWADRMAAKKQAKQDKKLDPLKERIAELEDRTKRQLAEFENFRKRSEKEKESMFEIGARSVIEKMLPVIDNFERGLATVPEDRKEDAFVDGMNKVYRQMLTELDKIGVKPIEAVGKEFDPKLHNAVMQVTSEEYEAGVVAQELQKGYTYRDSVVRHSMVAVVSEKEG